MTVSKTWKLGQTLAVNEFGTLNTGGHHMGRSQAAASVGYRLGQLGVGWGREALIGPLN